MNGTRGPGLVGPEVSILQEKIREYLIANRASDIMIKTGVHLNTVYNIMHGRTKSMTQKTIDRLSYFFAE